MLTPCTWLARRFVFNPRFEGPIKNLPCLFVLVCEIERFFWEFLLPRGLQFTSLWLSGRPLHFMHIFCLVLVKWKTILVHFGEEKKNVIVSSLWSKSCCKFIHYCDHQHCPACVTMLHVYVVYVILGNENKWNVSPCYIVFCYILGHGNKWNEMKVRS